MFLAPSTPMEFSLKLTDGNVQKGRIRGKYSQQSHYLQFIIIFPFNVKTDTTQMSIH